MITSLRAKEYMNTNVLTVTRDMNIFEAIQLLITNKISGAPVVDEKGALIGFLSEKDCLKPCLYDSFYGDGSHTVADLMTASVKFVEERTSIIRCAEIFLTASFHLIPVVERGKLVGQISRRDILMGIMDAR